MRFITFCILLGLSPFLLAPELGLSQFSGRSGRGFPSDPNEMFNRFSGGKDFIDLSMIPEQEQARTQMFLRFAGITPVNNQISRQQFIEGFNRMREQFAAFRGGGGFGGSSGMGMGGGSFGGPPGMGMGRGSFGGPPSMGGSSDSNGTPPMASGTSGTSGTPMSGGFAPAMGGFGPPGMMGPGGDPNASSDRFAEGFFRRADRNQNGVLEYEEMSDTLKEQRDRWDRNRDGFIDLEEYKEYIRDRMSQRAQEMGNANPNGGMPGFAPPMGPGGPFPMGVPEGPLPAQEQPDEEKPVIYRSKNMPKEVPEWFRSLDKDEDGQVALYEWRRGGRDIEEFATFDTNADGLITIEEVIRVIRKPASGSNTLASNTSGTPMMLGGNSGGLPMGGFGRGGFGGFGGGIGGGFSGFGRGSSAADSGRNGSSSERDRGRDRGSDRGMGGPPGNGGMPSFGRGGMPSFGRGGMPGFGGSSGSGGMPSFGGPPGGSGIPGFGTPPGSGSSADRGNRERTDRPTDRRSRR